MTATLAAAGAAAAAAAVAVVAAVVVAAATAEAAVKSSSSCYSPNFIEQLHLFKYKNIQSKAPFIAEALTLASVATLAVAVTGAGEGGKDRPPRPVTERK